MKRGHTACRSDEEGQQGSSSSTADNKGKNLWGGPDDDMDELLAVLGYKVRSSDMADVAHKLEQLEMALTQDDVIACGGDNSILDDAVHYNPSDLSSWVQTMLSEINGSDTDPTRTDNSGMDPTRNGIGSEYDDLRAIPGVAAYPFCDDGDEENCRKRMRVGCGSDTGSGYGSLAAAESAKAVVLVESQEAGGVRLVHTLMACAEAIQQDNINLADALLKRVGSLAASQTGAMRKVATFFTEALARRIYRIHPRDIIITEAATATPSTYDDVLEMHFYETSPCLKFAHFTANQAILEVFATAKKVHVIDLCLKQGVQWPPLLQALALRQGGPPSFRLTGIGPPQPDNSDSLQQVGWNLAQLAQSIGIEFEFKGFVAKSLSDLEPQMLETGCTDEAVAVNSVFGLHPLLAHPGAVEKVISTVKTVKPNVFTVVEQEADHNGVAFIDRFNEALHYYSSMFDSLECGGEERVMSELYLGRQILNVVAAEGVERVERHEVVDRWRSRLSSAGFERVHLGSNAFRQASLLLALFAGRDGFQVEENDGCLMLGWHTRPLIATSAWKPAEL